MKYHEISKSEWSKIYLNMYIHVLCHNKSISVWPPCLHPFLVIINTKNEHKSQSVNPDEILIQCSLQHSCECRLGRRQLHGLLSIYKKQQHTKHVFLCSSIVFRLVN